MYSAEQQVLLLAFGRIVKSSYSVQHC